MKYLTFLFLVIFQHIVKDFHNVKESEYFLKTWYVIQQTVNCDIFTQYDPITFHPVTPKILPAVPMVTVRSHMPGKVAVKGYLSSHNRSHTG